MTTSVINQVTQNIAIVNQLLSNSPAKNASSASFSTALTNTVNNVIPAQGKIEATVMGMAMAGVSAGLWKTGDAVPTDLVGDLTAEGMSTSDAQNFLQTIMTDESSGKSTTLISDLQNFLKTIGDGDDGGLTAGKDANSLVTALNLNPQAAS